VTWDGSGFSSLRDVITYVAGLTVVGYGLVVREAAIVVAGIGVILGPPALLADRKRQDTKAAKVTADEEVDTA
jgi:hypothetical protein